MLLFHETNQPIDLKKALSLTFSVLLIHTLKRNCFVFHKTDHSLTLTHFSKINCEMDYSPVRNRGADIQFIEAFLSSSTP